MDSTKSDKNGSGKKSRENTAFDKTSGNEENVANSECDVPELKAEAALSPEVSERVELDKKENCLREILKDGGVVKKMGGTLLLPEGNKDVQQHDEEIGNVQSDILRGRVPESMAKAPLSLKESKDVQPDQKRGRQRMGGNRLGLLALVGAIVCLVAIAVIYISPPERVTKGDFDLAKDFGNGVDQLQLSFTNQTKRFWKILKNRGSAHLRDNNPSQPLVFLLAAPPPAHAWVDCLATKLAEMLGLKQKRNLAKINGTEAKGYPGDEFKEKMDVYLKEKFEDDHRVAVIHQLELLPPPSALLFYSYCDDQNAPYKHVAIIFTVHLPFEPSLSLSQQEAEADINKYLLKEGLLSDDRDKVAAHLSRIADTVALMNGESGDSLKNYCS